MTKKNPPICEHCGEELSVDWLDGEWVHRFSASEFCAGQLVTRAEELMPHGDKLLDSILRANITKPKTF